MIKKILISLIFALVMACGIGAARADSKECYRALSNELTDLIMTTSADDQIIISSDGLIEFFTKNIDSCREYLLARVSPDEDIEIISDEIIMDINWDYIAEQVAAALTLTDNKRALYVCENNRSYQAGLDGVLWATTVIAAVFSFGTAVPAIQGAKAAVIGGGKQLVKMMVKRGANATIRSAAKDAAVSATAKRMAAEIAAETAKVTAARAAATAAADAVAADATIASIKQSLRASGKKASTGAVKRQLNARIAANARDTAAKHSLKLLEEQAAKKTAMRALAGVTEEAMATKTLNAALTRFAISAPLSAIGVAGSIYSFLASDLNPQVMNCHDLDAGEGCYTTCEESLSNPTDDLNTKVFKRVFGRNLCVDTETYILREITPGLPMPGNVFMTTDQQWARAKDIIRNNVADQGNCDWNEDDIDIYVGAPHYDPSTLEPIAGGLETLLIEAIRIDQ